MKYINCVIISALLFGLVGVSDVWAGPRAVPVVPVFEFEPVSEGQSFTHDFIIKNMGDALLNIIRVQPP